MIINICKKCYIFLFGEHFCREIQFKFKMKSHFPYVFVEKKTILNEYSERNEENVRLLIAILPIHSVRLRTYLSFDEMLKMNSIENAVHIQEISCFVFEFSYKKNKKKIFDENHSFETKYP